MSPTMRHKKCVHAIAPALLSSPPCTTRDECSSTIISFVPTQKQQSSAKKVNPASSKHAPQKACDQTMNAKLFMPFCNRLNRNSLAGYLDQSHVLFAIITHDKGTRSHSAHLMTKGNNATGGKPHPEAKAFPTTTGTVRF